MDRPTLIGQAVSVALGVLQQPSVEEIVDRGVNILKVVKQQARYIVGLDLPLGVCLVDDLVLNLSELHPSEFRGSTGGYSALTMWSRPRSRSTLRASDAGQRGRGSGIAE